MDNLNIACIVLVFSFMAGIIIFGIIDEIIKKKRRQKELKKNNQRRKDKYNFFRLQKDLENF